MDEVKKMIQARVPAELHAKFKTLCAQKSTSIQQVIGEFVSGSVAAATGEIGYVKKGTVTAKKSKK